MTFNVKVDVLKWKSVNNYRIIPKEIMVGDFQE